jgi:ATP-dependent Clp protease ATP-binding subunit ClpC
MYERFTDRSRKVMGMANRNALELRHACIDTEHVLWGLVEDRSGLGSVLLQNLVGDLDNVARELKQFSKPGTGDAVAKLPMGRIGSGRFGLSIIC